MSMLPSEKYFDLDSYQPFTPEEVEDLTGGVAFNHLDPALANRPETMSINGVIATSPSDSPSRGVMMAGHFTQRMVTAECDTQILQTGIGRELGACTAKVRMPEDGKVIRVIPRYDTGHGRDSFRFNPDYLVIYQPNNTAEFRSFTIPYRSQLHPVYGFEFKRTEMFHQLFSRAQPCFPKGTVFAQSPALGPNGDYRMGLNFKTAFISHPFGAEDGIRIWRGALKRLRVKFYERRTINCGSRMFPLPIHSREPDLSDARVFPEIGDLVPANGMLMALRPYGEHDSALGTSIEDLRTVDHRHDTVIRVMQVDDKPKAGMEPEKLGRVVDVRVIRSHRHGGETPAFLTRQLERYWEATRKYHAEIVSTHDRITHDTSMRYSEGKAVFRDEFHNEITRSLAIVGEPLPRYNETGRQIPLTLEASKRPLDEWRIDIVVEYEVTPDIGWKLTDFHGGKGTIVSIVDNREDMARDAFGNIADIEVDATSIAARMNLGRPQEHHCNGLARYVRDVYRKEMFGKGVNDEWVRITTDDVMSLPEVLVRDCVRSITVLQELFFQPAAETYRSCTDYRLLCEMVAESLNEEVRIHYPYKDRWVPLYLISLRAHKVFKLPYGPVTYRGFNDEITVTKDNTGIWPLTFMLLDKVPREWNSVSTGTLQVFGLPSPLSREEKVTKPWRAAYTRVGSETEVRLWLGYGGRNLGIELADRANNPDVMAEIAFNKLTAPKPTNINYAVNRDKVPIGGHRALKINNHMFACQGFALRYKSLNGFVAGHHEKHLKEFFDNAK